jgi:hypothetical protein
MQHCNILPACATVIEHFLPIAGHPLMSGIVSKKELSKSPTAAHPTSLTLSWLLHLSMTRGSTSAAA